MFLQQVKQAGRSFRSGSVYGRSFHSMMRTSHWIASGTDTRQGNVRTHMNHGGGSGGLLDPPPATPPGPRAPMVPLGLEAAQHTHNILRLLESSHGAHSLYASGGLSTEWHPEALFWRLNTETTTWQGRSPSQGTASPLRGSARLASLSFSDDRTALVKLQGADGDYRYLSLLRLDPSPAATGHHHHHHHHHHHAAPSHGGWTLVREIKMPSDTARNSTNLSKNTTELHELLLSTLNTYLDIEHGGGSADAIRADTLFHPDASLLAVGTADAAEAPSDWSAPAGSWNHISRNVYLDGVQSQTPHDNAALTHDDIVQVDFVASSTTAIAAATVRVGNGSQTLVFEDHLLLGYGVVGDDGKRAWQILSKVFSPQAWPGADGTA